MIQTISSNLGWTCPKCSRAYSPVTPECYRCNNQETKWTSNTTVPVSAPTFTNDQPFIQPVVPPPSDLFPAEPDFKVGSNCAARVATNMPFFPATVVAINKGQSHWWVRVTDGKESWDLHPALVRKEK